MKFLSIIALIVGGVQAGHISMTFRGLDSNYTFTPFAISALRETIACRAGLNHSTVILDSITIRNRTYELDPNHEVNSNFRIMPYNCHFLNSIHWDVQPSRINRSLLKELKEDVEVTFKFQFPGDAKKAYGANIMPFLASAVNEYYAEILENDYMAFYAGSIPELIHQHAPLGLFKESDKMILFYMFVVQLGLVIIGNIVLKKLKKRVPPLSPAAVGETVYIVIK